MKWGYIVLEYKFKFCCLCKICLDISFFFDFIIGFFGEIDKDFEDIMKLINDIGFDVLFSFIYSVWSGILVFDLLDDILMDVKKQCLNIF